MYVIPNSEAGPWIDVSLTMHQVGAHFEANDERALGWRYWVPGTLKLEPIFLWSSDSYKPWLVVSGK